MVNLNTTRKANAALFLKNNNSLVAVFVGATSDIGEYTLLELAKVASTSGSDAKLRVYLVGRNQQSADKIFARCRELCPNGDFVFVKAEDLSLPRDVAKACERITELEEQRASTAVSAGPARVDMLVMSQGILHFGPRDETSEGLDKSTSLYLYSRLCFTHHLLPLLTASTLPTGSKIISIYSAGFENPKSFHHDDLSLRKPGNFSFDSVRSHVTYMKTLYFESLAERHKGKLSCTHVYPSLVMTPALFNKSNPWWFRAGIFCARPFLTLFASSAEDIGQRVLFLASDRFPAAGIQGEGPVMATSGQRGGGAYSVKYDGETNDLRKAYAGFNRGEMKEKVWDHVNEAFEEISAGRAFKD